MPPFSAGVCDVEDALEETALELTADDDAALLLSLRDELTALDDTALEDDASLTADDSSVASEVKLSLGFLTCHLMTFQMTHCFVASH